MDGKTFLVSGSYREKQEVKKFTKEIIAVNENFAKEKTLASIGSKHKTNRHQITINEVNEKKVMKNG